MMRCPGMKATNQASKHAEFSHWSYGSVVTPHRSVSCGLAEERWESGSRFARGFGRLGLVAPFPTEERAATVFGDDRRNSHHTHNEENGEEDNGNHEDWHTAPLAPLCVANELASVTAVTGGCDQKQPARR